MGENRDGQLGLGHTNTVYRPVPLDLLNVTQLVGGDAHSLALINDGTVMAWGDNSFGQLGSGVLSSSHIPLKWR